MVFLSVHLILPLHLIIASDLSSLGPHFQIAYGYENSMKISIPSPLSILP